MRSLGTAVVVVWVGLVGVFSAQAGVVEVKSVEELQAAIGKAGAGDRIVVADGKYEAKGTIKIACAGTEQAPVVIEAKTVGGVEIAGEAGFRMERPAAYVVVKGFVFTHQAGAVVVPAGVHHVRFTRNVFALKVAEKSTFMTVDGDDNEIDHNVFRDKQTEGQMLFIQGPGTTMAKRNWVHHNAFLDFRNSGKNNSSGLHVGSSHRSMDSGFTVVEHNLFVKNVGENEGAICNKSCDNIYRFNTIVDSTELSLRHGHRCRVYGNFLINSEGGVRFFGKDHEIFSNYFEACKPAIAIGNGGATIPPGPLTSHERPDRVKVVYNTLVDNRANVQMGARKDGLGSDDLVFANNLIRGGNKAVSIAGPLKDPNWEGNIVSGTEGGDLPTGGFAIVDPGLVKDERGVWRLAAGSAAIGRGVGAYPFVTVDVDGQARAAGKMDVGADQFVANGAVANRPLTEGDVGPKAPEEVGRRGLIGGPRAEFIAKGERR